MATLIEIIIGLWTANPEFLQWYISQGRIALDYLHLVFDKTFYVFLYITVAFTSLYVVLAMFVMFSKKRITEKVFDYEKAPFVSVQIPTKNEVIALRCAKKCLEFDYPKDKYEIIIGDDSDKKSVSRKIDEFARKYGRIKVVRRKDKTGFKPGNLNNMLKHSKGEILVIFDSDFVPGNDFLKRIVTPFMYDDKISAVQAKWNFNNFGQNMVTVLASTIVYVFHHIVLSFMSLHDSGSLCGSAEAIKKKDLIELGGWRSGSLTEDIEYTLRLYKSDKKIKYLKNLECYSDVPHIASDLYKQQMRWAYGVIAAYVVHLKGLMFSRVISTKKKMLSLCSGFGYTMPLLMLALFATGLLSFFTNRPSPIDLPKFLYETGRNVLLTSGLLVVSMISLAKENKLKYVFKMIVSSFTFGLVITYYVNKGIFKSFFKKPMHWYLLNKNENINS